MARNSNRSTRVDSYNARTRSASQKLLSDLRFVKGLGSMSPPLHGPRIYNLSELEDRRRYNPGDRRLMGKRLQEMSGKDLLGMTIRPRWRTVVIVPEKHRLAKYSQNKRPITEMLKPYYGFGGLNHNVVICVRRKRRKEVMFAKGGAGRRKMSRPRFNDMSYIRC